MYEDLKNFPAPSALDALRRRGITHVIVHDQALYRRHGSDRRVRADRQRRRNRDLQMEMIGRGC